MTIHKAKNHEARGVTGARRENVFREKAVIDGGVVAGKRKLEVLRKPLGTRLRRIVQWNGTQFVLVLLLST